MIARRGKARNRHRKTLHFAARGGRRAPVQTIAIRENFTIAASDSGDGYFNK